MTRAKTLTRDALAAVGADRLAGLLMELADAEPDIAKRVRLSSMTRSAGALSNPDFLFIFAPCGCDQAEILPSRNG